MNDNSRDERITAFVRNVLGCGCPDEVFNKIEISNIDISSEINTATRIVVGDTLLIYLIPDNSVESVADVLGRLVAAGKDDRDLHGYNRFRLVVRSSERKDLEEKADVAFAEAAGDEKLHLHLIAGDVLDQLMAAIDE